MLTFGSPVIGPGPLFGDETSIISCLTCISGLLLIFFFFSMAPGLITETDKSPWNWILKGVRRGRLL